MAGGNIVKIGGDNWQKEVKESPIPVVVDFWAEWCGPCRAMNPVLEALASELAGKVKIAKANVDENVALAQEHKVRSIPTLLVFQSGQVREQMVGVLSKDALKAKISAYL